MMLLADEQQRMSLLDLVLPIIPWLLIIGVLWLFVFRRIRGDQSKAIEFRERSIAHWAAMEAKMDRMIELLEQQKPASGS